MASDTQSRRVTPPAGVPEKGDVPENNTTFLYRGHDDDRPLLWRHPLNELVGALNDLMAKRKKKLGPVLNKASTINDDDPVDPDEDLSGEAPMSARSSSKQPPKKAGKRPPSKRASKPKSSRPQDDDQAEDRPRSKKPSAARPNRSDRYDPISGQIEGQDEPYSDDDRDGEVPYRYDDQPRRRPGRGVNQEPDDYEPYESRPTGASRGEPSRRDPRDSAGRPPARASRQAPTGRPAPRAGETQPSRDDLRFQPPRPRGDDRRSRPDDPVDPEEDYEEIEPEEEDEDDDDFEDLGDDDLEEEPADGEIRIDRPRTAPGGGPAPRAGPLPAGGDDLVKQRKALRRELQRVRTDFTSEDVLLRLRRQQAAELGNSALECDESIEQARTWIKALEDVLRKRTAKLEEHDAKRDRARQQIAECERALELLEEEDRRNNARHVQDQASLSNTVKVEQKTHEQWRTLEEELRKLLKEVEQRGGEQQREQLRLTKHHQDLLVGEQEVAKRLAAQKQIAGEIESEGAQLHRYWRRAYLASEARVNAAGAEVEAEERARSHLVGHGDRIRAKLEGATGNLTAQMTIIEEQGRMDARLRDEAEAAERRMREVQAEIDARERVKADLEKQRDEVQSACQDKVEHLNSALRAIETSANAVATEQAIAQRTLSSSEEAMESIDDGEARTRLEEDVEALRRSLAGIEGRLREVNRERAATREMRAKVQKDALVHMAKIAGEVEVVDRQVEGLLAQRVQLEVEQREIEGRRVVVHARVKQCKKAVTPLEQERKLYLAELEWVREFEEHSFLRMQEKHEVKVELQDRLQALRDKGSSQLQEQAEDEAVVREGVRALSELKDKVTMHKDHVQRKLKSVQESIAQHEAEASSLSATMQALEGKMLEADTASSDAEERRLAEQGDWEATRLDWQGRSKEWGGRLKKEERALASLEEARGALQDEVDEVTGQLADQRHAAQNAASQARTLKGEKEALDKLVVEGAGRLERLQGEEAGLEARLADLKRRIVRARVGAAYRETLDH